MLPSCFSRWHSGQLENVFFILGDHGTQPEREGSVTKQKQEEITRGPLTVLPSVVDPVFPLLAVYPEEVRSTEVDGDNSNSKRVSTPALCWASVNTSHLLTLTHLIVTAAGINATELCT